MLESEISPLVIVERTSKHAKNYFGGLVASLANRISEH